MAKNIYVIGGSKHIGYHASVRLLAAGCNVVFLLRNPTAFDNDTTIREHIKNGKAHLVKGDALIKDNVQSGWDEAHKHGPIDTVLFTLGGTSGHLSLRLGIVPHPMDICTRALLNLLTTYPTQQFPQPKLILHTSIGLTKKGHAGVPLLLKPVYVWFLRGAHADKKASERLIAHCANNTWDVADAGEPTEDFLPIGWKEIPGLPEQGTLKNFLIVRPALLTDGECLADKEQKPGKDGKVKPAYRYSEEELGGYTISRRDVGHFDAEVILDSKRWEEVEGKTLNIGY
ncbi:hypothetical protein BDN72DRAFT_858523 [Pluteus cervinus]|uniref:Uncharacterized protein n=1 Tax=Pluteus cervinus TaxID=181527 RepID=A0ACD3AQT3_9AGAR|nr:hypothetical protein BDN72DRAFT_858523 [Pluteus cervinus]